MKQALILFISLLSFSCSSNIEITPSGKSIKEERTVSDFSSVVLSNGISLTISQDNNNFIMVEADDNIIQYVETYTKGKKLYIRISEGIDIDSYKRKKTANVSISTELLENLSVSGGSLVKFQPTCNFTNLNIDASGGSTIEGEISLKSLTYSISGGGSICLNGECKNLNINSTGGSKNHLYDFTSEKVEIDISGGSLAELYANKEIYVKSASGGSKIYYKGNPTVTEQNVSGGSSITSI